jgi:hypothetical protein
MTGHFAMTGMTISSLWDQTEKGVESLRVRNLDFTSAVAAVCAMGVRRWGGSAHIKPKTKAAVSCVAAWCGRVGLSCLREIVIYARAAFINMNAMSGYMQQIAAEPR